MDIQKLKAELIEEILDTIHEELSSMNACAPEKAKADETAGKAVNEGEAKPVEEIKEGAGAGTMETAETAETAAEVKEQTAEEKVEKPAEEKKAEEVIKIETLTSSPAPAKPTLAPQPEAWRNMSQKDFIQWIESGAYRNTI